MACRAWMIQGTGSGVGKSLITAALCRLLSRRGVRVAPFKAQNMALNAAVTRTGHEIGRAQAFQAEAAGIEPHVDMNPILLKPTGDQDAQVIVLGEVVDQMSAARYFGSMEERRATVCNAYDRLAARFDCVILEGAGSPAEINLRERDLVNMSMARHARAPVWIVADIDRGGVFASIKGTFDLLQEQEQEMVDGFLINRFRGDVSLLMPGIQMLKEHVAKPVHGVLPWLSDLDVDEEDAPGSGPLRCAGDALDIAVLRLRHIANFTDFSVLAREPSVQLRYVEDVRNLGEPDLLILPGTKSTSADIRWLESSGLAERVRRRLTFRLPTFGICGGYQMLGQSIEDPEGVDGVCGAFAGLGALPIVTRMRPWKHTAPFAGVTCRTPMFSGGLEVVGYEIHMGESQVLACAPSSDAGADVMPMFADMSPAVGLVTRDGAVGGCYVHGCFDSDLFRGAVLDFLRRRRGLQESGAGIAWKVFRETRFERLADWLEQNLPPQVLAPLVSIGV